MEILSSPKSTVVSSIRQRGDETSRYNANLIEQMPGDTVGDALYSVQQERESLLQTRHRCLAGGLGLFALAGVGAVAQANGLIGNWVTLGLLGTTLGGCVLVAKGGMTGDKIHHTEHKQHVLSHWCKELRHEGSTPDGQLVQKLGQSDRDQPHTKAELVDLLESVARSLAGKPGPLQQVQADLKRVREAPGETLDTMREASRLRSDGMHTKAMWLCGAGGLNMLSLMVTAKLAPAVGVANSVLMCGLFGAGIMLQDRGDQQSLLRDTLDRWELQLTELKDVGRLVSTGPGAQTMEVRQGAVVIGGVRVPVKVPRTP